jgi:regulator of sigma E protease
VAFLHECGHLFVACWSGVKVEVFSVGVGPASLRRGTRWWLAVIPIGGYVRFVGDRKAASAADGGASELVDRDARQRESCSATAADAGPRSWPPGRPPISLRRSHLLRPRLFAGEAIVRPRVGDVVPGLAAEASGHMPRELIESLDDPPIARSKNVIIFVSLRPAQEDRD